MNASFSEPGSSLEVLFCTFAYDDRNGCPSKCNLSAPGDPRTVVLNSAFIDYSKTGSSTTPPSGTISAGNCQLSVTGGLGLKESQLDEPLTGHDGDGDGVMDYFLKQGITGPCLDGGTSDAATYPQLSQVSWTSMTTSASGCTDSGLPDAGRHYVTWAAKPTACK